MTGGGSVLREVSNGKSAHDPPNENSRRPEARPPGKAEAAFHEQQCGLEKAA